MVRKLLNPPIEEWERLMSEKLVKHVKEMSESMLKQFFGKPPVPSSSYTSPSEYFMPSFRPDPQDYMKPYIYGKAKERPEKRIEGIARWMSED
jgi:hypothetical protein